MKTFSKRNHAIWEEKTDSDVNFYFIDFCFMKHFKGFKMDVVKSKQCTGVYADPNYWIHEGSCVETERPCLGCPEVQFSEIFSVKIDLSL